MPRSLILAIAAIAVAVLASVWFGRPAILTARQVPLPVADELPAALADASAAARSYEAYLIRGALLGPPPASLQGTSVDGELVVDAQGRLVPSPGLRRVFDYFLVTLGEEDLEAIKARIAWHLKDNLPPAAALEAWAALEQYLGYQQALRELPARERTAAGVRQALRDRQALRAIWFTPAMSEAFFGFEDAFDNFTLARMEVLEDDSLDPATRQRRLEMLEQELPAPVRERMATRRAPVSVSQEVARRREVGASEAEISALRAERFGDEAAERLAQLDREREQWQRRYDAYRRERERIRSSGLAAADREAEIARLQARLFDELEIRRVQALDRIEDR